MCNFISWLFLYLWVKKFFFLIKKSLKSTALGTIPFYIAGELLPQNFRSLGQALVFFCFNSSAFIFSLLILPSFKFIGVWSFIPLFIIPQICCLTILWLFLPETR
jgi:hypothetical protein